MIRIRNGIRTIYCSFCNDSADSEAEDFMETIDEWKEEGWRMFKKDDDHDWTHICPECRANNRSDQSSGEEFT